MAAADAVPVNAVPVNAADDIPVNKADPVNDVRVNPAGSVNDVGFNPDDVNAVANAVQDADVPANPEGGNAARAKPSKKFSKAGILVKNIAQGVLDSADEDEREVYKRSLNMSTFERDNFHPFNATSGCGTLPFLD